MRLPTIDKAPMSDKIDENESIKMIHYAIDNGVNYIDTAYPYHKGVSEILTGKALKSGYRNKVRLATKLPMWNVNQSSDFEKFLDEQLKKLQTDHIDFYLFHSLGTYSWKKVVDFDLLKKAEDAVKDGRIGYIGFSFHDEYNSLKEIIDGYDKWTLCQIQYNYMDVENQAGTKGLKYAASKGIAVVVMEPLLGGRLAKPPVAIKNIFNESGKNRSSAEWAFQWVWNQSEVSTVLSGMNSMEQVVENVKIAQNSAINSLKKEELAVIENVRNQFIDAKAIPCTKCGYCIPCPNNVNIPRNFELYNNGVIDEDWTPVRGTYKNF